MSDDLLEYYNRELSYIRKLGVEFAKAHPDVAPWLRFDAGAGQDPYVERLLEGFAYLTARVRKKIADEFPEIAEALLNVLYPHFLAPVPSMSIAQFELAAGQGGMINGYSIARGAGLETEEVDGEACRFRTCFDLALFPVRVTSADLAPLGRKVDLPLLGEPQTALRVRLSAFGADGPISSQSMDRLRFFIAGEPIHANALYEALFTDVVGVALSSGPDDPAPVLLPEGCLQPCGFGSDEAMLPFGPRSFAGYRLLTEYFALPERFRFLELVGLGSRLRAKFTSSMDIVFFLKQRHETLQRNVVADTFRLGCTPIINLFEQRVDPFRLSHTKSRYPVVPDVRRLDAREIYSIDRVAALTPDGKSRAVLPFYSLDHAGDLEEVCAYWYASRRVAGYANGRFDAATEVDLSFVDLEFSPRAPADWTIEITATCLNRDLPSRLPFGGKRPVIRPLEGGAPVDARCLTPPTPTRRPFLRDGSLWRLISQLSLNHLSLVEGELGAQALQEMLAVYDVVRSAETAARIQGIESVRSQRVTERIWRGASSGFSRGVEVRIEFNEERFADRGLFLFASVLERFLGLYCSVNSFTKLVARSRLRKEGVVHRWSARAAEDPLL